MFGIWPDYAQLVEIVAVKLFPVYDPGSAPSPPAARLDWYIHARGCANTTITVLRVPASVSEYSWMLEKSHFVYM